MTKPTVSDYATLSAAIYNSDPLKGLPGNYSALLDRNGNVFRTSSSNGLIAEAFIDNTTGNVIIAFEGTQILSSSGAEQLDADALILSRNKPLLFDEAETFVNNVENSLPQGASVYVTGHSLGGAIAEYVAAENPALGGSSFGAPQIGAITGSSNNNSFVNYVDVNDPVSNGTGGGYVGQVQYIDTKDVSLENDGIVGVYKTLKYHLLGNYLYQLSIESSNQAFNSAILFEALANLDAANGREDDLSDFKVNQDGSISSNDGALLVNVIDGSSTVTLQIGNNILTDRENADQSSDLTVKSSDGSSSTTHYTGPNGTGFAASTDDEHADGTSTITTRGSDGSSVKTNYTGPNGTGKPTSSDAENADGTSTIRTYNPDGSSTANTYSGPNGTGDLTGTESFDADGDLKSGDFYLPSGGRLHLTSGAAPPTDITTATDGNGVVHFSGTFNGATLTAFGGIVSFALDGGWANVDFSAYPHAFGQFIKPNQSEILQHPSDTVYLDGISYLYPGQFSLSPGLGYWTSEIEPSDGQGLFEATDVTMLPDLSRITERSDAGSKSDILLQHADGTVAVWQMNGLSITASGIVADPGPGWHAVGKSGFSGAGSFDILLQHDNGTVALWQMNGLSVATSGIVADPGPTWHAVDTGDFDGDGRADILFQNDDGSVAVWQMNGQSITTSGIIADPGPSWHAVGTGDFDGDGKSDILFQNDDGTVDIWQMQGRSITASGIVADPGPTWHAVGTGDFDGDGKSDILFQNDDGTVDIWQMNGLSITISGIVADPGPSWHAVGTGDYNGDGKSDILFQNDDGTTATWQMNGQSIAASGIVADPGISWQTIGQGDMRFIDGAGADGDLYGTSGPDQFVLTKTASPDVIYNFDPARDSVALSSATFANYTAVVASETSYANGTFIQLGSPAASVFINDVIADQLHAANFVLR